MGENVVSLFTGIGGFDLGLERAGCRVVLQVETDPFCQRVLAARWPNIPRRADVRDVCDSRSGILRESAARLSRDGGAESGPNGRVCEQPRRDVDLLVGGFPCQDLSVAGKRVGLGGARSSLFHEFVRIAKELKPTWGLVENVPGLVSSHHGRDLWTVLSGLRECWPVVGYRILDSQYFGVPQRRRRVFIVGGPSEAGVTQVLALFDGGAGHSPAGSEAGAEVAYALAASVRGTGDGHGNAWNSTYVTGPLGGGNDGIGRRSEDDPNLVTFDTTQITLPVNRSNPQPGDPCHPLAAGMHAPTIAFHSKDSGEHGRGFGISVPIKQEHPPAIAVNHAIRRLTPVECERLQGFPDGWTCLCQPLAAYAEDPDAAALRCRCPDSPRYRALGNAVTVNVVEWLGQRMRSR